MNENQVPDKSKLFAKMVQVMAKMTRVQTDGQNTFHNYKYATASDVADMIRAAMAEAGLALLPEIVSTEQIERGKTTRTRVVFNFTFCCSETGATHTCRWEAEADNNGDKGINIAATAAEKYFLMKTFIVSTGDEPDADSDDGHQEPRKPAQQQTAAVGFADVNKAGKFLYWAQKAFQYSRDDVLAALRRVTEQDVQQLADWDGTEIEAMGAVIAAGCDYDRAKIEARTATKGYRIEHFDAAIAAVAIMEHNAEYELAVGSE